MSAQHATAAQLAGLPNMPGTKSSVIRRAETEGWQFVEESGRGGVRRLYLVEQLPAATRAALAWGDRAPVQNSVASVQEAAVPAASSSGAAASAGQTAGARLALQGGLAARAAQAQRAAGLANSAALTTAAQARMDARLAVVQSFERYAAATALTLTQARIAFALSYTDGTLGPTGHDVPTWARDEVPTVSDSTLERWQREIRLGGITALAGAYGNRAGSGRLDSQPALREFVQAMLVQFPHARATQVMQGLEARFADAVKGGRAALPSMRSLERWMAQWRDANAGTLLALANPDAWKNQQMVAFGSQSEGITQLNQRWELDSSPFDVMAEDGRYSILGVIDVAPRRARLLVSRTSKAEAVAALLRGTLLDWGVPHQAKTDNGSDYTSHHITRVFGALDVEQLLCPPFQPWHKPHIERFFGTFTRDLVELLAGFIGHNVAERNAIEARTSFADRLMKRGSEVQLRMTGVQLQAFCDDWLASAYMHNPHESLAQRTPFQAVAESTAELRRIDNERALDVLLAQAPENNGRRTVQKKGVLLDKAWFIAPELEAWVGRQVQVRYDALHHDLGKIFVFGEGHGGELEFVCVAECPERTGMDRREVAIAAKRLQTTRVQAERRALKAAAKQVGTDQVVGEILRHRAAQAGKLASLPRPALTHTSAGLEAAAHAAQAATAPQRTTADIEQLAAVQAARARIAAEAVPQGHANALAARRGPQPAPVFESVPERMQWLLRQAGVRPLSTEEQDSLAQFKRVQPASYRRMADLVGEQNAAQQETDPGRTSNERARSTGSD